MAEGKGANGVNKVLTNTKFPSVPPARRASQDLSSKSSHAFFFFFFFFFMTH